ncbi:regulatory Fis family protein [Thermovibrio guaymasensis]|uniref:Regulatory Fis family protein n=1 Tax=Thermovibrio guaymasensis TaxID=240167 RepID=A0A420W9F2_9BACT|nr:response regulator [Thermovibrio guaymasensis]RKQ63963.1 regulatory Fis family protein [Thermovibrio guaymasensis]
MMKVLIVDDEKTIRETLKEILEEEGYQVFTEEVGSKVVERVKELQPNLIILDLFLPGISGMEVLKKLNEEGLTEKIPVVIVSGHGTVETAVKAMKLKAYDFIEKPIKYEKFLSAVEGALKREVKLENEKTVSELTNLPLKRAKEEFEKAYIKEILKKFNGDLKRAAAFMEIDISNLYRKLNKYGFHQ